MNDIEHLLTVLAEEGCEVAERACKAMRFGMNEIEPGQPDDNRRRIQKELADVVATAELLGFTILEEDKAAKREKLKKFMEYARSLGTLEKPSELPTGAPAICMVQTGCMGGVCGKLLPCEDHAPKESPGVFCLTHRKVMVEGICPKCVLENCLHPGVFRGEKCKICGQDVR